MTVERRRDISPKIVLAIQDAVTEAFKQNAHRCLIGMSEGDKHNFDELKSLLSEYPPQKLRESFALMKTVVRIRNTVGNILVAVIFSGLFLWGLNKVFPSVWNGK